MTKYEMQATKSVAYDSPDHIVPRGTKNDNSRNPLFNRKFEALFRGKRIAVLDLGCAGGGFVKDCLVDGHQAVGVEGSDYSKRTKRAEWAVIPENLFTADITTVFQLFQIADDRKKIPAKFDLITGWELLEHLREQDLPMFVENLRRHMNPNCLCVFSIADFPDEADGVVYHQSVHPRAWWVDKFAALGLRDHRELVSYFDPDWIRGPLQGSQSFHVVLSLFDASVPTVPAEKAYTTADLVANGRMFLRKGLENRDDGGKALHYSIRCLAEAELTSRDPLLPHLRGISFLALGDNPHAAQAAAQSLRLNPDYGPARRLAAMTGVTVPRLQTVLKETALPPADRLLTLLIGARNDAYMGDFKWRISTCLNYLARNLAAIGRLGDVEVLVVDWNSDVPLRQELRLSEEASLIVRFIAVPPEIAQPAQLDSPFPIPIVQNVAIRRARGEFIGQTDTDILFTRSSLLALFHVLDGNLPELPHRRALLVASRRHVPFQQVLRKPGLKELDAYLMRNGAVFPREEFFPGFATPSALALMHRDIWQACRGYDERLVYWGWMEIDLYLRLSQRMPWLDVAAFGVNLIHIEHYTSSRETAKVARKKNPMVTSLHFEANDENWGLAGESMELASACTNLPVNLAPAAEADTVESLTAAMAESALVRFVSEFSQSVGLSGDHASALVPLAWYARERFPRTYVDIGARFAATAAIVVSACPGVEVYGIDSWHDGQAAAQPPIWVTANAISKFGQRRNYARFITGDAAQALERLFNSPAAPESIDLALVRTDPKFGDAVKNALDLARHLSPGGALVVSSRHAGEFDMVWKALEGSHPGFLRLRLASQSGDFHNGIALAPAAE